MKCAMCNRKLKKPYFRWRSGIVANLCGEHFFELVGNLEKPILDTVHGDKRRVGWQSVKAYLGGGAWRQTD